MTLPLQLDKRHITQAKHNESLLSESCFPNPCSQTNLNYKDWTVTIAFYVALHYLEAYLHQHNFRTSFISHTDRNDYLKRIASLSDRKIARVLDKYLALYKLSKYTRYTACSYHYLGISDLCDCFTFALKELPQTLGL
jgi:hypothetical protein